MQHRLVDRANSILIVIDVQPYFLDKLPQDARWPLVARIGWLMRVAKALSIPVIATAEDIASNGPLVPELTAELPGGVVVHDKMVFGLAGQQEIIEDVRRSGRSDCVLIGLETDVCIAHSALGLMEHGLRAVVIADATASPPPHHAAGLKRIAAAGGLITDSKGIHYEWVRDLATLAELRKTIGCDAPPGVTL
jgi:nicotinamidase-related amidase